MSQSLFSTLPLSKSILTSLETMGYSAMTPIQAQSLPAILASKDVISQAQTGSGKTAAFGIGAVAKIDVRFKSPQVLILCPTRELVTQVASEIRKIANSIPNIKILTLCGGVPKGPQVSSLEHGAHIIVGTPGRLLDHIGKRSLDMRRITMVVLDEADRMLDMGFGNAVRSILNQAPKNRQTLLFSATLPDAIKTMSESLQTDPILVKIEPTEKTSSQITQIFYEVEHKHKGDRIAAILAQRRPESALVFCGTKANCQSLAKELQLKGHQALALHGDLDQRERVEVLALFSNRSCSVLIATDVAARGLDIKNLDLVIVHDLSPDPEVHVHRIGRTGRAGESGLAISLVAPSEHHKKTLIEQYMKSSFPIDTNPPRLVVAENKLRAPMATLQIAAGKKDKIRPADILGALTGDAKIDGKAVGKIDVFEFHSLVAIERTVAPEAFQKLSAGKIKGRSIKIRWVNPIER